MSKLLRSLVATSCVFVVAGFTSCEKKPNFDQLDIALADSVPPYKRYKPARSDWGPGVVFEGDVVKGEIQNLKIVCRNLFGIKSPTTSFLKFADYSAKRQTDVEASLELLTKVIKNGNEAKFDLAKFNAQKDVDVKWIDIKSVYYAKEDAFKSGAPMLVEADCKAAIESLKNQGKFNDRLFIILEAIKANNLSYTFSESRVAEMGIEASLQEVFTAKNGLNIESSSKTTLEISGESLFVGYSKPELIVDWAPSDLVGGNLVNLSTKEADLTLE